MHVIILVSQGGESIGGGEGECPNWPSRYDYPYKSYLCTFGTDIPTSSFNFVLYLFLFFFIALWVINSSMLSDMVCPFKSQFHPPSSLMVHWRIRDEALKFTRVHKSCNHILHQFDDTEWILRSQKFIVGTIKFYQLGNIIICHWAGCLICRARALVCELRGQGGVYGLALDTTAHATDVTWLHHGSTLWACTLYRVDSNRMQA